MNFRNAIILLLIGVAAMLAAAFIPIQNEISKSVAVSIADAGKMIIGSALTMLLPRPDNTKS